MRKDQAVHIHGLLSEISDYLDAKPVDTGNRAHDAYGALGMRSTSIHRSTREHELGVLALVSGINIATGERDELPTTVEDALEEVPSEHEDVYGTLRENAVQETDDYGGVFKYVELTEELLDSIGSEQDYILRRLDIGHPEEEYGPGDRVRIG